MILSITPRQARLLIGNPRLVRHDCIVPAGFAPCPNSPYQPEYDWLFQYERSISGFLETWLQPYRYELIGEQGILCEALSNAFFHGHRKDPGKPIELRVLLGETGLLVEIEDSGGGFDPEEIYTGYQHRRTYFAAAGNGIRLMARSLNFGVFHSPDGKTFHLLHLFNNGWVYLPRHFIRIAAPSADKAC